MSTMRISQLAERTGVPATTLRFYETAGLLPAERTRSGYRVYGEEAVERLAFIGAAEGLGLPLEEIAELLGGPDPDRRHPEKRKDHYRLNASLPARTPSSRPL
jgi:DNA-binding transcriptional MerR regulator